MGRCYHLSKTVTEDLANEIIKELTKRAVDKADVDETNATAKVENISKVFEQTQVAPETDALFFSKAVSYTHL